MGSQKSGGPQVRKVRVKLALGFAAFLVVATLPACETTKITANNEGLPLGAAPKEDIPAAVDYLVKKDLPLRAASIVEKLVAEKKAPAQFAAQYVAMLGIESATDKLHFTGMKPRGAASVDVSALRAFDAIDEIIALAKQRRIVVINESHWHQRHRAFGHLLAKELSTIGFTHLGVEGIFPGKGQDVLRHGPQVGMGFYPMDPFFADFIRQTQAMGYSVFEYEQRPDQTPVGETDRDKLLDAREPMQAENIVQVLKANANARIMLYVGGAHGMKKMLDKQNHESTAIHLQRLTGLDVLSIDQQAGTPTSDQGYDTPIRQAIEPLVPKDRPSVFRKDDGQWLTSTGYDLIVFHPRLPEISGRAGWMEMAGYRKKQTVKLAPRDNRTLLRARAAPLVAGAIAYDQVVIAPQQNEATLFLPIGEYELFRETESGATEPLGRVAVRK
jgi:hypothetical protein